MYEKKALHVSIVSKLASTVVNLFQIFRPPFLKITFILSFVSSVIFLIYATTAITIGGFDFMKPQNG